MKRSERKKKMSHNLAETNGKTAMMYYGEKPWHGLGTELDHPAHAWEAMEAAGLDFRIDLHSLYTKINGNESPVSHGKAVIRGDNGAVLGIVGNRYTPVQNKDAFGFMDGVVGDGAAMYHTAGALGLGERIWLLAKLPSHIQVTKEDTIDKYLCLVNSHDGSMPLKVFWTPIRVVCQNTLTMALNDRASGISLRHTLKISDKLHEAQRILGVANARFDELGEIAKVLITKQVTKDDMSLYVDKVLEVKKIDDQPRLKNQKQEIVELMDHPTNRLAGMEGSAWAAYNSVTYWADYNRTVRNGEQDNSRRLKDRWFGTGASIKERALDVAVATWTK